VELKDVLGKLGRLDANELNATGQKHIELGECLVKLAETLQTLETIDLPSALGLEVKPALPEPEYWPVKQGKIGRPKRGENRQPSARRKNLRRDVIALMQFQGVSKLSVEYIAQRLEARQQAVRAAIAFGKGEQPAHLANNCVVLGEKPDRQPVEQLQTTKQPTPKKVIELESEPNTEQSEEDFDEVLADQIHRLLSDEGSMPVPAIAARLKLEAAVVGECCRGCPWFSPTKHGDIEIAMC
jgi:hypothetical protein